MKKLLGIAFLLAVMITVVYAAGEVVYYQGNTEAIRGIFQRFYLDSLQQKADSTWRTVEVPEKDGIGYNLKIWIADPSTREESLRVYIWVNSLHGVENVDSTMQASIGVIDFGYDNKADTFYFYGSFSDFKTLSYTNTAGADAPDSISHIYYQFSGKLARSGWIW